MNRTMKEWLTFNSFFFFNDPATTEIYTLSLHDALPISPPAGAQGPTAGTVHAPDVPTGRPEGTAPPQEPGPVARPPAPSLPGASPPGPGTPPPTRP